MKLGNLARNKQSQPKPPHTTGPWRSFEGLKNSLPIFDRDTGSLIPDSQSNVNVLFMEAKPNHSSFRRESDCIHDKITNHFFHSHWIDTSNEVRRCVYMQCHPGLLRNDAETTLNTIP